MNRHVIIALGTLLMAGCTVGRTPSGQATPTSDKKDTAMTTTMERTVTMKGKPLALAGNAVHVGQAAPEFVAVANDLSEARLSAFRGKVVVLAAVPSLDTSVCSMETHKFNERAAALGGDVVILTISMDLPFAQKRWCGAEGIRAVQTLSDHRDASFGTNYGVLIPSLRLLARGVFVVDRQGKIVYAELVKEIAQEPDYDAILAAAREAVAAK